jgi:hypothetical protein
MYYTYKTVNNKYIDKWRMTMTKDRPIFSSERAPHIDKPKSAQQYLVSGHQPQMGLNTKMSGMTDRR